MLSKQQKINIIRCVIALVAMVITMIVSHFVEVNKWILLSIYIVIYLLVGGEVLFNAVTGIFRGQFLDENFLMTLATIGAFAIGEYSEAVAVMLFFQVGELFQQYAVNKSRGEINTLVDLQPDTAILYNDGTPSEVDCSEVKVGDILLVQAGGKVAVDGEALEFALLDNSALTGESIPYEIEKGEEVLSGGINAGNAFTMKATKVYEDSAAARILDLVENASNKKSKSEKFISRFARFYTPIVVVLALLLSLIPPLIDHEWSKWVFRGLTFLVVSCPCALVISVPLAFFVGIGRCAKVGALVKGSNYIEMLAGVDKMVTDKTGTLTTGQFSVVEVTPESNRERILELASMIEGNSSHPIAKAIVKYAGVKECNYEIYEIKGRGMRAVKEGSEVLLGKASLMADNSIQVEQSNLGNEVYVAENGKLLGKIVLQDTIRSDAREFVEDMHAKNISITMLTGDTEKVASQVSSELNLDEYYSNLLPEQKVEHLEKIINEKDGNVAFIGDGINDSPSLARADVGLAMGGVGSDSAIEVADVVLVEDKLTAISKAIKISKEVVKISKQNIVFALAIKIAVLILSAIGFANMWLAIFADVGVAILAILNSMRAGIKHVNKKVTTTKVSNM